MGCGCGKKFTSPIKTASSAVNSNSIVPPQVQRATVSGKVVTSQVTPYQNGKMMISRRTV